MAQSIKKAELIFKQYAATLCTLVLSATISTSFGANAGKGSNQGVGEEHRSCGWLKRVNCNEPSGITDGTVDYIDTGFEDTASYSCDSGFELVGLSTRTCLSNQSWSGEMPTCIFGGCGSQLPVPTHGDIIYTGQQQGDIATITCDTGYTLTGTGVWTCLVTGWSGSDGDCYPVPCQALQDPVDGSVIVPASPVFEDEAVYSCNSGFTLSGQERRCCLSTGLWSGAAPTCVFAGCGSLSAPTHGYISYTGQQLGDTASINCDTGYTLGGTGVSTCRVVGWDEIDGNCVKVSCPPLSNPTDGTVSTDGNEFEDEAVYSCNPTFNLIGANRRWCSSTGDWTGTVPTCEPEVPCPEPVQCPALADPDYGTVDVSGQQPLGSTATYTCTHGLVDGDPIRYCVGTDVGGWTGKEPSCASGLAGDCDDVYNLISTSSGVYNVYPCGSTSCPVEVYCQMTPEGGWTVFQRRVDNTVDFYLNWADYKNGFGDPSGNVWLGLENLYQIVSQRNYELRVELEDFEGNTAFAEYGSFSIGPESDKYRLTVSGYKTSSSAGDSLTTSSLQNQNNQQFSTPDSDNDNNPNGNCVVQFHGPWWHNYCHRANLNGRYFEAPGTSGVNADGIIWVTWRGYGTSLKGSVMMIK